MLSYAVEGCLSKLHILQENRGKGGRKTQEKRVREGLFDYLVAFRSAILSVRAANSSRPSASPRMRSSQPRL